MALDQSLLLVLARPSPATLWQLRGDLLETDLPDASFWSLLDAFYVYLSDLVANTSSHEYSQLASLFDVGALSGVIAQNLLADHHHSPADLWQQLLVGGFSEGLMVLASRQYVKAAEAEMKGGYRAAAWYLYGELWRLSAQLQPDQAASERRQNIDKLLAPVHQEGVRGTVKAALLGRLFQVLLLIHLRMSLEGLAHKD